VNAGAMNADVTSAQVKLYSQELKMPGLRHHFEEIAREARANGESHEAYLVACLRSEIESRREHRLQDRLKQARFAQRKTLEEFDFALVPSVPKEEVIHLGTAEFVRARENVIFLGASGTGKTHLAQAIGQAAIYAGVRVRFTSAVVLAQELLAAQDEHRLPRYLKSWQRTDLVIIDELGYLGLGPGGPLLFQFFAERYEKASVLVTSNLEFSRWSEVFGDPVLTAALLDRLTHHSHILVFEGESYRFRESQSKKTKNQRNP
jgi:DNA replication protein DnaC